MKSELQLRLSPAAERAVEMRHDALVIEVELLFSCLIRKRVKFPARPPAGGHLIHVANPKLAIYFHPIATRHCRLDEIEGETPSETLPVVKQEAFIPRWLALDYRHGTWHGDFGYVGDS